MIDIHQVVRQYQGALKMKGEDKKHLLVAVKAKAQDFLRECAADFSIPYDHVVTGKQLADDVESSLTRMKS